MEKLLKIIQIITSALIIIAVLLQGRNSSLSNLFGGSSNFYTTERGAEKFLYITTIVLAIILTASIIVSTFVK